MMEMLHFLRSYFAIWIVLIVVTCTGFAADCPVGDLGGDCAVGFDDLVMFAEQWLGNGGSANLDNIGAVNMADFSLFAGGWLTDNSNNMVVINELMAKNTLSIQDEAGQHEDWIELYNSGPGPARIGGMYLTDRPTEPDKWWPIPAGAEIPSGGYLIIWADGDPLGGDLHATFSLSQNGETVALLDSSGATIDSVTFGVHVENHSYGRFPDAGQTWRDFDPATEYKPTPRTSNGSPVSERNILVNEIMYWPYNAAHPFTEDALEEYIELLNNGDIDVNVSGWRITDAVDYTVPPDTIIKAHNYLVIAADMDAFGAIHTVGSNVVGGWVGRLSDRGEPITLMAADGRIIDQVTYSDEGDWSTRRLGATDVGHRGWEWSNEHDGGGASLELIAPHMPNEYGQNWASSLTPNGTPGLPNTATGAPAETEALVITGAIWKYNDKGLNLGTPADGAAWFGHVDYDDGPWAQGASQLGYGDGDESPTGTVGYGGNSGNKYVTTYFRHEFTITDASRYTTLTLRFLRDDGGVVYLNGEEAFRSNMPDGEITYLTRASSGLGNPEESTFYEYPVNPARLLNGRNVLAVEIHQYSGKEPDGTYLPVSSSDISFDLILEASVMPDITPVPTDVAPFVLDVKHTPVIPHSDEEVTVTARIIDELSTGITVKLYHRIDRSTYSINSYPSYNPAAYDVVVMADDGLHGDGGANDGVYGGRIPATLENGAIVEFFVEATDGGGNRRTWPAPSMVDGEARQVTNLLYQVDDGFAGAADWNPGDMPSYRIIMTNSERGRLADIGTSYGNSNAQMNATFISVDGTDIKVRYNVGVRNRGHGSRTGKPNNYRVNFIHGETWKNVVAANINARNPYVQLIGSTVFQLAGLPMADSGAAHVLVDGTDLSAGYPFGAMYGSYVNNEALDSDFARRHFPGNSNGNLYKCMRVGTQADLRYEGTDGSAYSEHYFKHTNESQNDWSDLIELTWVLTNTPDSEYAGEVKRVVDTEELLRLIALNALLDNVETTLANGNGDDYYMYRGDIDTRFAFIQYDLDSIFGKSGGSATAGIFKATGVAAMDRFLNNPEFMPRYYYHLNDLMETILSEEQLDQIMHNALASYVKPSEIEAMKDFARRRNAYVAGLIERDFAINIGLGVSNGYYVTTSDTAAVSGTADVIETRAVRVNGQQASWSPRQGTWSATVSSLKPGINRLIVQTYGDSDGVGTVLKEGFVDVWRNNSSGTAISGAIGVDMTLDAASGPWHVVGNVTVPAGVTLTVEPGASLFFDNGTSMTVNGRFVAEGNEYGQIRFTRTPGSASYNGIQFANTMQDNRITWAVVEYGVTDNGNTGLDNSRLTLEHVTLDHTDRRRIRTVNSSLVVRNCMFTDIFGPQQAPTTDNMSEHIWGSGIPAGGEFVIENNLFGTTKGHNDIIDFDGPFRPAPVAQILGNVFMGSGDDLLDLEVDAHIEGNTFQHVMKDSYNTAAGRANVISAGAGHHFAVVRNLCRDIEHVAQIKDGAFMDFVNNTVVDASQAALYFYLAGHTVGYGRGVYVDGCIFADCPTVFSDVIETTELTVNRSMVNETELGLGVGNVVGNPWFANPAGDDFSLLYYSPAKGGGPNGIDMGWDVEAGVSLSGGPGSTTHRTNAAFVVGGPGIVSYSYRLSDNGTWVGDWTGEIDIAGEPQISVSGLLDGHSYELFVIGKNSAGQWQAESEAARWAWTVNTAYKRLVINEVLANNVSAVEYNGTFPDVIELYYDGAGAIDLGGMSISDDPAKPRQYVFDTPTTVNPGQFVVLYCEPNSLDSSYLNFSLNSDGDGVHLYDKVADGGGLVDSVEFGLQAADMSIGRIKGDEWRLTAPTFGTDNRTVPLGNNRTLKINEWYTEGNGGDFIELFNPDPNPVDLSDLYLTDNPVNERKKDQLGPLSFAGAHGFAVLKADGSNKAGHVNFHLSPDREIIGLFDENGNLIDKVIYYSQTANMSQGRVPDGSGTLEYLMPPTPGRVNHETIVINEILAHAHAAAPDLIELYNSSSEPINIRGWFLSDSSSNLKKYEITDDITIEPNDYSVFNETDHFGGAFALSENGDTLYLSSAIDGKLTEYRISQKFGASPTGVSFGRHPVSTGRYDFVLMSELTMGRQNTLPKAGPVVISEVMYHPQANGDAEYVELLNLTSSAVPMYDSLAGQSWILTDNNGIDYQFPSDFVIQPNERMLVVKNLAAFQSKFTAYPGTRILQWDPQLNLGSLSNSGEGIELAQPGDSDTPVANRRYIRVDYVEYSDGSHPLGQDAWPSQADGNGMSLQRVNNTGYGNDVDNWQALNATPGS
jgi:hypothetical protein